MPTCTSRPWEDENANGQGGSTSAPRSLPPRRPNGRARLLQTIRTFDGIRALIMDLVAQKAALRAQAIVLRNACDPALGAHMAKHVLQDCMPDPGTVVAGFWPLPGEIDIRALLRALATLGYDVVLPVTPERGRLLTFRKWNVGDALIAGRFGTSHTDGVELDPGFILLPLLGFDASGNRLGYGGGYYDRTLAALPAAFRMGCAFAAQEFGEIPAGPDDIKLHAIVTEAGIKRFASEPCF